jgi:hypothetical protein
MSLTTSDKIRTFQRKLYCKAKAEPAFRFYVLYDKVCREDILHHAYRLARANAGAPSVDEVSFVQIEELGHDKLETTARYTRVATGMIAGIESPLDLLSQPRKKSRKSRKDPPPA